MVALVAILVILVVAGLVVAGRSFKVVQQYEQGIIFRFGKVLGRPRGAGLTVIRPVGDRMQKVNMQIVDRPDHVQPGAPRPRQHPSEPENDALLVLLHDLE